MNRQSIIHTIAGRLSVAVYCGLLSVAVASVGQDNVASATGSTTKLTFVARDRGGNRVQDLKTVDVAVLDNGSSARVLAVEQGDAIPVRLGILLYSDGPSFKAQQDAAIQLLSRLRPQLDQAFVLTQAATRKVDPFWTSHSRSNAWPAEQVSWNLVPQDLIFFVRALHWDNALLRTSEVAHKMLALDREKQFRRILVEFRDPQAEAMIELGDMPYRELEAAQLREIAEYQRANSNVYTIAIPTYLYKKSPRVSPTQTVNAADIAYTAGESRIERIATMTGGRYFPSGNNFKSDVTEIQSDLQNQYIISFVPQAGPSPDVPHKLEIRVNRENVQVRGQNQYYPVHP